MCLQTVTHKFQNNPLPITVKGYKVVYSNGKTFSRCFALTTRWQEADTDRGFLQAGFNLLGHPRGQYYPVGFHIFAHKEDAIKLARRYNCTRVVEVEGRNIVAIGTGDGFANDKAVNFVALEIRLVRALRPRKK